MIRHRSEEESIYRKWKNAKFIGLGWGKIAAENSRLSAGETHLSPFSRRLNTCDNALDSDAQRG